MSVLQCTLMTQMSVGVSPREWRILTDNTFSAVTTAGYLTSLQSNYGFEDDDFAFVTTSDLGVVMLNITVSTSGVVSLVNTSDSQVIDYPVTAGHIAVFSSTSSSSSTIGDDATTAINGGNLQAGLSGTSGALISYPTISDRGRIVLAAGNNVADYITTITNASMGQASAISIPDPAASTANFVLSAGTNTMASSSTIALAKSTATEAGNAVTINQQSGVITTSSLTTAAGSTYTITFTNSKILTSSVVLLTLMGGTNTTKNIQVIAPVGGAGSCTIIINNNNASATAMNGTLFIGFAIF